MSKINLWQNFQTNTLYFEKIRKHHIEAGGCAIEDRVRNLIDSNARGVVLDAGCGEGSITKFFARQHPDVRFQGVDISPIGIRMAQEDCPANCSFQTGWLEKLNYESEQFDLVYCQSALEHVKNLDEVLNELHRVLRKNGRLIIRVGNGALAGERIQRAFANYIFRRNKIRRLNPSCELRPGHETEDHRSNFDSLSIPSDVLLRMLRRMGFRIIHFATSGHDRSKPATWKDALARKIMTIPIFPLNHLGWVIVLMAEKNEKT